MITYPPSQPGISIAQKGAIDGVASLDNNGYVPLQELPPAIITPLSGSGAIDVFSGQSLAITALLHTGKRIRVHPGSLGISFNYPDLLDGFFCVVLNRTGYSLQPQITGFTSNIVQNVGNVNQMPALARWSFQVETSFAGLSAEVREIWGG